MSNIQISKELFFELLKYHLVDLRDDERELYIQKELQSKLDKMAKRELYGKQFDKTLTQEEQELARTQYLDLIGMHKDFRY